MLLSQIRMYRFLGTIYVCLLLNAVHLAFVNCLTAARKLIDSIYSGFCDESERERLFFGSYILRNLFRKMDWFPVCQKVVFLKR